MKLQKLLSLVRQAIERYQMIDKGDRIAVGVSGGKDSLTLLYAMKELSRFYPKTFEVCAVCVDLGYENTDFSGIQAYCDRLGVECSVIHTQIARIVLKERKESHPCSLCATLRKGALVSEAGRLGCNKIAYAHHLDDFVETMLLSLIFQGQFYAFPPVTRFEDTGFTVLRPMMLVKEAQVRGFCTRYEIPVMKSPCPVDGTTKRQYAKELLAQIQMAHPGAKDRMFHAILEGNIYDWPKACTKQVTERKCRMKQEELLKILSKAARLKTTLRHCYTAEERKESVADHSWRIALMAMLLSGEEEFRDTDMNKVIRMCLIHDLGEAFTGDIPTFEKTDEDVRTEDGLFADWVSSFSSPQREEWEALLLEMGRLETREAKTYKALDKLEAVISHNESDISTWLPLEYDLQLTYGKENVQFSEYLKELKCCVDEQTKEKIKKEGA